MNPEFSLRITTGKDDLLKILANNGYIVGVREIKPAVSSVGIDGWQVDIYGKSGVMGHAPTKMPKAESKKGSMSLQDFLDMQSHVPPPETKLIKLNLDPDAFSEGLMKLMKDIYDDKGPYSF